MGQIRNTFQNGMVQDSLEFLQPEGTYRLALNAVHQSRDASNFGLVNEEGREVVASFGADIVGKTYIEERNQTLVFLSDGSLKLFNHRDHSVTHVVKDSEFGCDWDFDKCEFLYAEFKQFNACNELHAYWSSNCIYHVVNIDEMLDSDRRAAVEDCSHFDVFKCVCGPHISGTPAENSGSTLEAGSYSAAVQLKDNDGNTTNVFDIGQKVSISGENSVAGENAQGSIRFQIDSLDKRYDKLILYIIKTVGQVTTIEKMDPMAYTDKGITFTYSGQKGELVDVSVLVNKNKAFLRGQDLIQKDGRMFFYSLKNERNLNYQKYANAIQVEWVEWEVSMEQQRKYHFPGLMRGEVYAIGIVWKFCDGTYSDVFHIPGGGGSGGGSSLFVSRARSRGNAEVCYDRDGNQVDCSSESSSTTEYGGGGSGSSATGASSDGYNPLKPEDLDTEEEFERKRNPTEVKDRPNESDLLEEDTRRDVSNIDTNETSYVDICAGLSCVEECRCCECDQRIITECCEKSSDKVFQDPLYVANNEAGDYGCKGAGCFSGGTFEVQAGGGCGNPAENVDGSTSGSSGGGCGSGGYTSTGCGGGTTSTGAGGGSPCGGAVVSGGCGGGGCGGGGTSTNSGSTGGQTVSTGSGEITGTYTTSPGCAACTVTEGVVAGLQGNFPNATVNIQTESVPLGSANVPSLTLQVDGQPAGTLTGSNEITTEGIVALLDPLLTADPPPPPPSTDDCKGPDGDCDCSGDKKECIQRVEGKPGCDTSQLPKSAGDDIMDLSSVEQNNANLIALYGRDYPDPLLDRTANLKDAALDLIDNAVIEREYIVRKRPVLNYSGSSSGGPGGSPEAPDPHPQDKPFTYQQQEVGKSSIETKEGSGASLRGDNWVDGAGNSVTDEPVRLVASGAMEPYSSTVPYPDDVDCDGRRFYPGGNVRHHRVPWTSSRPHFTSGTNGVENQYQPSNYPYGKTYVRPMGVRLSGITFPNADELPKPLCPNSPFKVVYVKRTDQNKSVFAKGFLTGMFQGENHGDQYLFPRHGVNSFETVDRMIAQGDSLNRKGSHYDGGAYTFHSPDTDCDNSYLPVNKIKSELALRGSGWRYGLYAEGKKPEGDQWSGTQKDNRGARVANNLNHYAGGGGMFDLKGITYAPANTVVSAPSGVSLPLMNRFRESSVYLEASGSLPGSDRDKSFVGDVLTHFAPTECNAPYAALVRELPDQYGSVESLRYAELGLNATQVHANGASVIEGVCGDTFIGPYSKRRTSYVSNKQGDFFHPPEKPGSPCRERSWCDSPDDKIFQYFGIDHYPTKLPKSGDKWDPKNYAGLHTIAGDCGEYGHSKTPAEAAGAGDSETDFYWPRTLKSLVHSVVESHVNPWLRETGEGSQLMDGKVYYPRLKDLHLDADGPTGHPWEESFLTRFYAAAEQPSIKQLTKKALIRTAMNLFAPAGLLTQFQEVGSLIDGVSTFMIFPMLAAFWIMATNTLFTDRRVNQMLRIGECLRDEEGGDLDEKIENFEDAYARYNWDFSEVNDIYPHKAFPLPYNTCDCDACEKDQLNNEIYHSAKQNLDSEIDAYKNVKINNYNELPAHAGNLKKLFVQGNGFYALTTDGIWLLKFAPVTIPTDIASQQAGTGELLAEPQLIFEGVQEGFAGTNHPNALINTAFGVFYVDDEANKIYRFNGAPEEISAYGMFHFFKNNLGFCDLRSCFDEKTNYDNHYSLGWDPRYNRLLVTKYDGSACSSFTASYTPLGIPTQGGGARGKWISFHSYVPQDYLWDRKDLYSIEGNNIYIHHTQGKYQSPFIVEFPAVAGPGVDAFDFKDLILHTHAELATDTYPLNDVDVTFDKVAVWNDTQGTGTRPIEMLSDNRGKINSAFDRIKQDYSKVRFVKKRRVWQSKEFTDLVKADCEVAPLLSKDCDCTVIPTVNEEMFDCRNVNTQDMKGRILSDKYLMFRYTLDSREDLRLYLTESSVFYDNKPIPKD